MVEVGFVEEGGAIGAVKERGEREEEPARHCAKHQAARRRQASDERAAAWLLLGLLLLLWLLLVLERQVAQNGQRVDDGVDAPVHCQPKQQASKHDATCVRARVHACVQQGVGECWCMDTSGAHPPCPPGVD